MMRVLLEKPYFYTVSREETTDEYFLEVVCGTSTIYLFRIKLRKKEIADFFADEQSIGVLACRIMGAPDSFLRRKI